MFWGHGSAFKFHCLIICYNDVLFFIIILYYNSLLSLIINKIEDPTAEIFVGGQNVTPLCYDLYVN